MLIPSDLGFQALLFFFAAVVLLWVRRAWINEAARSQEIRRLVDVVSKESAYVEFEAVSEYNAIKRWHQCAICFRPTTTRCSRCKSVHYCSGKCQIFHWRSGHKDECVPLVDPGHLVQEREVFGVADSAKQYEAHGAESEPVIDASSTEEVVSHDLGKFELSSRHTGDGVLGNVVESDSQLPQSKMAMSGGVPQPPAKLGHKKSSRRASSYETLARDSSNLIRCSPSPSTSKISSVTNYEEDNPRLLSGKEATSLSFDASSDHPRHDSSGLKKLGWIKLQQSRASKEPQNCKMIFPYELFVKLYSADEDLRPFGLVNCGNSCYANAVLQCLAFTRPLTSYLASALHSYTCRKKEWCFLCEFEYLILRGRKGESPLSPIRIFSKIEKFGRHLTFGREEDAHEFLRYAVDTMQSVCLKEPGASGTLAEETTLVGLTFGGYLQSKIKCMRCHGKSERFERMMDIIVEIDANIGNLEEALALFTADEILDGENKYSCSRCKSYVRAKKKLSVLVAPNILTIVLKRFQSGNNGKLNKPIQFPEVLDMTPFMTANGDKSPQYSLYGVIVHRDTMNATNMGHYVCYVKSLLGEWFGINDSSVTPTQAERVLLEEAYILLYARLSPRAPALIKNGIVSNTSMCTRRNLEAIPSSLNTAKKTSPSHITKMNPLKTQQKHDKHLRRMSLDNPVDSPLGDLHDWRFQQVQRVSHLDSSSESSSSVFSSSDASSCSTTSTNASTKSGDLTDIFFGDVGPDWYHHYRHSSDSNVLRNQ